MDARQFLFCPNQYVIENRTRQIRYFNGRKYITFTLLQHFVFPLTPARGFTSHVTQVYRTDQNGWLTGRAIRYSAR